MTRVAITGLGVVSALGDAEALWRALAEGRSALREWPDLVAEGFRTCVAARIGDAPGDSVARALGLGVDAALAAYADAGQPAGRLAIVVGSTMGVAPWYERPGQQDDTASGEDRSGMATSYTGAIAAAFGGADIQRSFATACAAGNYAIGAAARLIAEDRADVAIAGGVDAFSRIALTGFSRSRAMDPDRCRPFDSARAGMQLGEGAGFVVLETATAAARRGQAAKGHVRGFGLSCDAYHVTAPRADGSGMRAAMQAAMTDAGVTPAEIAHVCAHATGTRVADAAEARAIADLFGRGACVGGVKGALGHAMGAAAAIEAIVTVMALARGVVPPCVGTRSIDPALDIDVAMGMRGIRGGRYALNNAFGFGGINSSLLLEAA